MWISAGQSSGKWAHRKVLTICPLSCLLGYGVGLGFSFCCSIVYLSARPLLRTAAVPDPGLLQFFVPSKGNAVNSIETDRPPNTISSVCRSLVAGSELGIFPCHWWTIVLRVNVLPVDHTASWIAAELGFKWAVIQNWIRYEQISKARRVWPGWVEQLRRMLGWCSVEAGSGHLVWLWWFIQFWAALTSQWLNYTHCVPL